MAFAGSRVLPRDSGAGSNSNLTAGAIAGIACGAGALFLGAAGLFFIYWRRQRQFDLEDDYYHARFDGRRPPVAVAPALAYTMDYKLDHPQHHEGDQASAYTYSPEYSSHPFTAFSSGDAASPMPVHPAYIPRALLRGTTTPSNRSVMTGTTSPPPYPGPASSADPKLHANDAVIQAYLNAGGATAQAADPAGGQPSPPPQTPPVAGIRHPGLVSPPLHSAGSSSSTDNTSSGTSYQQGWGGRPPTGLPPRPILSNKPLPGRENMTISGPLAFPHHFQAPAAVSSRWAGEDGHDSGDGGGHYHYGDEGGPGERTRAESAGNKRSFRSRAFAGGFGSGSSGSGSAGGGHREGRDKGKKHDRKRSDWNSGGGSGNRHYAEIEIGRDSDIW